MIRVFPYGCKRETVDFMQLHIWPIIYLPVRIAKKQNIDPSQTNDVKWACVGCVEDRCHKRQQRSCFV